MLSKPTSLVPSTKVKLLLLLAVNVLIKAILPSATVENALALGRISRYEKARYTNLLLNIVNHPDLKGYFDKDLTIYKEKDILVPERSFIRPDRVVRTDSHWAIIDYKTGKYNVKHEYQINRYSQIIHDITKEQSKKFLVYIGKKISVKPVF